MSAFRAVRAARFAPQASLLRNAAPFSAVRTFVAPAVSTQVQQLGKPTFEDGAGFNVDRGRINALPRYCLLDVGYAFEKGDYSDAFLDFFADEGETWEVYNLREGHWPAEGDENFDGFVVGGSWADAYADDDWIVRLRSYLCGLHERHRRIFGCCFGAQIVAHALGGRTAPASTGWEIGVVECTATPEFMKKWYVNQSGLTFPSRFGIHQSHYDQVMDLPEGAERLFSSDTTANEGFGIGDTVLCIQGHPEWSDDMTSKLLDLRIQSNAITAEVGTQMQATLGTQKQEDMTALKDICKRFLKTPAFLRRRATAP